MLIKFSVENYLSFREEQVLDFTPDSLKELKTNLHIPYLYDIDHRLLKSLCIYGHNSHGKSNLLKSYVFFRNLMFSAFQFGNPEQPFTIDNYRLNEDTLNKPTNFEITFLIRETKYRYKIEIKKDQVVSESLHYSEARIRENYLFVRENQEIRISKAWSKENEGRIEQTFLFTKKTHLFLSALFSQENITRINGINKWLKGNVILPEVLDEEQLKKALIILNNSNYRNIIHKFITKADLGFETIIDKIDSYTQSRVDLDSEFINLLFAAELTDYKLYSKHNVYNSDNSKIIDSTSFEFMKNESAGTIKYFILVCYLTYAIKEGQLILIDELDSKLHVFLLQLLVYLYHDAKINTVSSQMIFTTHSTMMLSEDILRRDQFVIVEKNEFGESKISKMHSSQKPIRIDLALDKAYLKSKLGGTSKKIKKDNSDYRTLFDL